LSSWLLRHILACACTVGEYVRLGCVCMYVCIAINKQQRQQRQRQQQQQR
jgi:hypothetical protein